MLKRQNLSEENSWERTKVYKGQEDPDDKLDFADRYAEEKEVIGLGNINVFKITWEIDPSMF